LLLELVEFGRLHAWLTLLFPHSYSIREADVPPVMNRLSTRWQSYFTDT
jgi:hypothetical protein